MWISILFGLFGIILESSTQELTSIESHAVAEKTPVNQGVNWDLSGGPPVSLNVSDDRPKKNHEPQNEISNLPSSHSNQWRPFSLPVHFNPYENQNFHHGDYYNTGGQLQPDALRVSNYDLNGTTLFHNPYNTGNQYHNPHSAGYHYLKPYSAGNGYHYPSETDEPNPYPSRSMQNQFAPQIGLPMFYPAALSINVRRTYENNVKDHQNSSNSTQGASDSEPVASTFEERYSQVVPSLPFSNTPFIPNTASPFNNYGYPQGMYPPPVSSYGPPYSILRAEPDESSHHGYIGNTNVQAYDREMGVDNAADVQEQAVNGRPTPVQDFSATYYVPRGMANFAPPNSSPTERFPIAWPFPILPPLVPSAVVLRGAPPNTPSLLPESSSSPEGNPSAVAIPPPALVDDRLPLASNYEAVAPETSLPVGTLVSQSLHVADKIKEVEDPDSSKTPYEFGFDMNDGKGTDQHRMESSDASGVVRGSYGYRDMLGTFRLVSYVADKNGFRAFVKSNEPGVASSGSADVVVMAEHPPPRVAEGEEKVNEDVVTVPDEPSDLMAEASGGDAE